MAGGASVGIKVGIEGQHDFVDAVKIMSAQAKALNQEMVAVSKGFVEAGDTSTKFERQSANLSKQIENQKALIETLSKAVEESAKGGDKNAKATADWQAKLAKAQGDLATMEQNLDKVNKGEDIYNKNTDEAKNKTKLFGDVLKAELISKAVIEGIKSLADGFKKVGEAIVGAFNDSVKWADELNTLSAKTGVSTEKLQEWEYMAKLIDVDVNTLTSSNTKLIKTMASAQSGSASASEAFAQLGVAYQNTDGSLRSSEQVMMEVIGALGNVANETERDALAMQIFGKSALELNPLIKAGEETLASLAQEAHEVGYVLDSDAVGALNRTQDAMDRMENASDGLKRQLSAQFAPVIADAFEAVIPVVNKFGSTIADVFKGNKDVSQFVDEVMASLEQLLKNFEQNLPQFLEKGEKLLKSLVEGIQRTVPKLLEIVVPLLNKFGQTIINNLGTILDTGIKILMTLINGIIQALPSLIGQIPTIITTIVSTLMKNLPALIDAGIRLIGALIQGIVQMGFNLGKAILDLGKSIVDHFKGMSLADIGKELIQGLWNGIQDMRKWLGEKIKSFCKGILNSFKDIFGIHSPSKVFADVIGANMALGIGEGFNEEMTSVAKDMTKAIPVSFGASGSGSYKQMNLGGVNITVNGAEGQNVQELADEIMYRMQTAVSRREAVFA